MQAVRNGTGPDLVGSFPTEAANYLADDLLVDFAPFINDPEIIPNWKASPVNCTARLPSGSG